MIRMEQRNLTGPMNRTEAQAITDRIRGHIDAAWADITKAYEGKAWKALGYTSWEGYVKAEFDMSRRRSYQLLDQGRVIGAIAEAAGDSVNHGTQISERTAREIKPDLPAVTAEIKKRVEAGENPETVVKETVDAVRETKAKAKAEREAQQAEHDHRREEARAALPDAIKQREQTKADAIAGRKAAPDDAGLSDADRIAELEEAIAVLEKENSDLKTENKLYAEMKVQFEQGGFAKVIAGKDKVIEGLETRVYRESADKASWMKLSKFWEAEAKKLGFSRNAEIDIETGKVTNG